MLDLVIHPDDRLREVSTSVGDVDAEMQELAERMIDTMHEESGIGLAGVQVGRLERIFVVHVSNDKPRVFINPEIIGTTIEETSYEEGCLSIPGVYADVVRPEGVTVQALNERGRPFRLDADGMLARVILHEFDHLKGVLFIDYLSERKRQKLMSKYERVAGG
jgi:peptide deformylase